MTTDDELKTARRVAREQRARADHAVKYAAAERAKRKTLQRNIKAIEGAAFVKGSATAVAHYMASWPDDGPMMWFQNLVRNNVQRRPSDAAEVAKMVDAICERHGVEVRGSRELIELVYEPQLLDSKNAQA